MPAVFALAPIVETAVAALCAMLLLALGTLVKYIVRGILSAIPVVSRDAVKISASVEKWMKDTGTYWWEQSLGPMIAIIWTPVMFLNSWADEVGTTFEHIGQQVLDMPSKVASYIGLSGLKSSLGTMEHDIQAIRSAAEAMTGIRGDLENEIRTVAGQLIAEAVATAKQDMQHAVNEAEAYAERQAARATAIGAAAQNAVNQLSVTVGTLAQSLQHITAQIGGLTPSAVTSEVQAALDAAEAFTQQMDKVLSADITEGMSQAEQDAAKLVSNLSAVMQNSIAGIDQVIKASREQLGNEIATAEAVAETYADKIAQQLRGEIGQAATEAAGAGAATAAVSLALDTYLKECGNILCANVKPQVPWIQDLEGIFEDGMLFALIAECLADPQAAAAEILSIVQPFANLGTQVVHEMMPR